MRRLISKSGLLFAAIAGGIAGLLLIRCEKSPDEPDADLYNLRITEVNYNAVDGAGWPGDSLEFIELKNTGSKTLDVGSLGFTSGIDYTFPTDATIPAGGFYLLASSGNGFAARYGFKPDAVYGGQLKNSGEKLEIYDWLTETTILTFTYGDSAAGWPAEADGEGYSLVPVDVNPDKTVSDASGWRRSVHPGGSPGEDDIKRAVDESLYDLRITEIHYHPADPDTFSGDSLEFIELKNVGSKTVSLNRAAFTSGITYQFAEDATIDAGSFIVLASSTSKFRQRYNRLPYDTYSGLLSNSGETITLTDAPAGEPIISISYYDGAPWPGSADGEGYSLVPYKVNPDRDENRPDAWRRSFRLDGSPGSDDPGMVVVNEIVSNPTTSERDAIELYNPGDAAVNIGGWFLTDNESDPAKFRIPDGTVIEPDNYLYFTDDDFNDPQHDDRAFSLSSHGDDVYLMSDSGGCTGKGFCNGFHFGELETGYSFGRYITEAGEEVFTILNAVTLGQKNSGARVGPVVITEIMYRSPDGKGDFIEITSIDFEEVRLYDRYHPDNTWKIEETGFSFPANTSIKPDESILIISDSLTVAQFRNRYGIADSVKIFRFNGALSDDKQMLSLMKPEDPYTSSDSSVVVPYMAVDAVKYSSDKPWPKITSGVNASSLQRIKSTRYGNDPYAWKADQPTPGINTSEK